MGKLRIVRLLHQRKSRVKDDYHRGLIDRMRRSSVFPGRQSMAPGTAIGVIAKETRPVRNQQFQQTCQTNIHEFLIDSRYGYPMNAKTLTSPTQKDFQYIVTHLIQILFQGGFTWNSAKGGFESECYLLLKDLKYPAYDNCGKTALGAPGTPQNWPHMLAMLNWLVDLCKVSLVRCVAENKELIDRHMKRGSMYWTTLCYGKLLSYLSITLNSMIGYCGIMRQRRT
jgi:SMC interacting uncharacterized protein involved in chromosome segregation